MPLASARDSRADVDTILESLSTPAVTSKELVLVLCVGLPGTGKSTFARRLAAETGAVVLESDALRRSLFHAPRHLPAESARLFAALHAATRRLIEGGRSVIVDATNLQERDRRPIYEIADETGARLVILRFDAPRKVVEARLSGRSPGEADLSVYNRLEDTLQPPSREHWKIYTSDAGATEAAFQGVVEACRPTEAAGTGGRV